MSKSSKPISSMPVTESEIVSPPPEAVVVPTPTTPTLRDLEAKIEYTTQSRELIKKFIEKNLVKGVDYGGIHVAKECTNKYSCKNSFHFSKDSLFKSGSEKFTSLFNFRTTFVKDDETWEMAGKPAGLFCYKCHLLNSHDEIVAEGRGACSISEKSGNVNSTIKIAQKRAQVDAILRHGALSDIFTQDLEDMPLEGQKKSTSISLPPTSKSPDAPPPKVSSTDLPDEGAIKQQIANLCAKLNPALQKDATKEDFNRFVATYTGLSLVNGNYQMIITRLQEPLTPVKKRLLEGLQKIK